MTLSSLSVLLLEQCSSFRDTPVPQYLDQLSALGALDYELRVRGGNDSCLSNSSIFEALERHDLIVVPGLSGKLLESTSSRVASFAPPSSCRKCFLEALNVEAIEICGNQRCVIQHSQIAFECDADTSIDLRLSLD